MYLESSKKVYTQLPTYSFLKIYYLRQSILFEKYVKKYCRNKKAMQKYSMGQTCGGKKSLHKTEQRGCQLEAYCKFLFIIIFFIVSSSRSNTIKHSFFVARL